MMGSPLVLYKEHTGLDFDLVLHFGKNQADLLKHLIDAGVNPFTATEALQRAAKPAKGKRQKADKAREGKGEGNEPA